MRLDQWLWAVRLFQTRSQAAAALKNQQVRISGAAVKPAREARPGDVLSIQVGVITRTVRVLAAPPERIGAKLVPQYLEDLTPPEEYEKARSLDNLLAPRRPKGSGRPTKLDRRATDLFLDPLQDGST